MPPVPPDLEERFAALKAKIIKPENHEKVKQSWIRVLKALEEEGAKISKAGPSYVPDIKWTDIVSNNYRLPEDVSSKFKTRGCIIVRGVVPREQIDTWFDELVTFCKDHPMTSGYTYPNPASWYNVFWSRPQTEARSYPSVQKLMKSLNKEFYVEDKEHTLIDLDTAMIYGDRIRIRQPGAGSSLNLHLDSGAIERWEDDNYRSAFNKIFEGEWEHWDPFRLDEKAYAEEDCYKHVPNRHTITSAFRTLQGWLALSDNKTGEGTLRVVPNMRLVGAYILLRPFFWKDPESGNPEDYEIDVTSPKFPGASPACGQLFLDEFYHHLYDFDMTVGIPDITKGDFVFWHADLAHEVDKQHNGPGHSSVFYCGLTPLALSNIDALLETNHAFRENRSPKDFNSQLTKEQLLEEEQGADVLNILNDDGLRDMGFLPFDVDSSNLTPAQVKIRTLANEAMKKGSFDIHSYKK